MLLAVSRGDDYQQAATAAGRRSGDAVSHLVARFNAEGLAALSPRHGSGQPRTYDDASRGRILREVRREPTPQADGTATWSLSTLKEALRSAPDGLPKVARTTIWQVLHEAGYSYQQSRTWCPTGSALRKRVGGTALVIDPDGEPKKVDRGRLPHWRGDGPAGLVHRLGRAVQDRAVPGSVLEARGGSGPATARVPPRRHGQGSHPVPPGRRTGPRRGRHRLPQHHPARLDEAGTGRRARCDAHPAGDADCLDGRNESGWERWQAGLKIRPTLLADLPPLRMLLVLDNLAGHKTAEFVCWLFSQGIMPLYTPVGGSWLNMAESIQRILKRRALDRQHPTTVAQIMARFEAVARHWNAAPTPFEWGGRRAARRQRQRERRHRLGGS